MAANAPIRSVVLPYSVTTQLLSGFTSRGFAQASLKDLVPVYPCTSIQRLSDLKPNVSPRAVRGAGAYTIPYHTLEVILFKKLNPKTPAGISSDTLVNFFNNQFNHRNETNEKEFREVTQKMIANPSYKVLVITALVFDIGSKKFEHVIVCACLYMHDKHGSFVFIIGVEDHIDSHEQFVDPNENLAPILGTNGSCRHLGLGTFMLSLLQVLARTGYVFPPVNHPTITCNKIHDKKESNLAKHHIYLQARLEVGSAYVFYVKLGFTLSSSDPIKL
jgi:hypothetical protein